MYMLPGLPNTVPGSHRRDGLCYLQIAGLLPPVIPMAPRSATPFRFWIDFQILSDPRSAALAEKALIALGGELTGGPRKYSRTGFVGSYIKDYGYMHMHAWDLLWSITAKAMLAAEVLRPGQLVSVIPGFLCVTRKTSLVRTLLGAYGEDAWQMLPRTWKLPEQLGDWTEWLREHPARDTGLWMLKNNAQRGTGLRLVTTGAVNEAMYETTSRPGLNGILLYRWYLLQQYITRPLLLHGRKSGLRVWVVVPDIAPLRAYIHSNALLLFSIDPYDPKAPFAPPPSGHRTSEPVADVPRGHVTNYAQNEDTDVWDMLVLRNAIGTRHFDCMWNHVCRSAARVMAAALRRVRDVRMQMSVPPRSGFQLFGLDFVLDEQLVPWLLEVNATPSMKVAHSNPATEQLIYQQKWPVVRDMFALLGVCPQLFVPPASDAEDDEKTALARVRAELQRLGGFQPLMQHFPFEDEGALIPWSSLDLRLRSTLAAGW